MKTYRLLFLELEMPYLLKENSEHNVVGASVRLYALFKGLVSMGHKVGILTWKGAKDYVQKEVGFDLVESFTISKGNQKLRWFYHICPKLYFAVKSYKPDFVFQRAAGDFTGVMMLISKQLRIPFVYMAANDMDADGRYKERLRFKDIMLYEYGIKGAERLIVQNNYQKKEFNKRRNGKKISVVYNPYYYEGNLPAVKSINERAYVAWVGYFQYQKNLPALLKIIKNSPNIEFRIAGTFSSTCPCNIKKVVEEIADCSNVKMVGYIRRKEIIPFLANAFVLLNTSHYEGFSNTFLESFAAGTPVITTRIDPDNIIATNKIGIVTKDYEEIPESLNEMINKIDYKRTAEKCRVYVEKNHNVMTIAEKFVKSITQ